MNAPRIPDGNYPRKVMPVIERTSPFEQLPDAIRHVESGNARGKVVVTVD